MVGYAMILMSYDTRTLRFAPMYTCHHDMISTQTWDMDLTHLPVGHDTLISWLEKKKKEIKRNKGKREEQKEVKQRRKEEEEESKVREETKKQKRKKRRSGGELEGYLALW